MTATEKSRYDAMVHTFRMLGWSRPEAEGEALERIERDRHRKRRGYANNA